MKALITLLIIAACTKQAETKILPKKYVYVPKYQQPELNSSCYVKKSFTLGIPVVEFRTVKGVVVSKMPLREATKEAISNEMISLSDMGICNEDSILQVGIQR